MKGRTAIVILLIVCALTFFLVSQARGALDVTGVFTLVGSPFVEESPQICSPADDNNQAIRYYNWLRCNPPELGGALSAHAPNCSLSVDNDSAENRFFRTDSYYNPEDTSAGYFNSGSRSNGGTQRLPFDYAYGGDYLPSPISWGNVPGNVITKNLGAQLLLCTEPGGKRDFRVLAWESYHKGWAHPVEAFYVSAPLVAGRWSNEWRWLYAHVHLPSPGAGVPAPDWCIEVDQSGDHVDGQDPTVLIVHYLHVGAGGHQDEVDTFCK